MKDATKKWAKTSEVADKMINGEKCQRLFFKLARLHGKLQPRAEVWLNSDDMGMMRRGLTWSALVTDRATGTVYHVQGEPCGATDFDGNLCCNCDVLAWTLTAREAKKAFKQELAELIEFNAALQKAAVWNDDGVFRIVNANQEEVISDDEDGYAAEKWAVQELAEVRENVAKRLEKAKAAAA